MIKFLGHTRSSYLVRDFVIKFKYLDLKSVQCQGTYRLVSIYLPHFFWSRKCWCCFGKALKFFSSSDGLRMDAISDVQRDLESKAGSLLNSVVVIRQWNWRLHKSSHYHSPTQSPVLVFHRSLTGLQPVTTELMEPNIRGILSFLTN